MQQTGKGGIENEKIAFNSYKRMNRRNIQRRLNVTLITSFAVLIVFSLIFLYKEVYKKRDLLFKKDTQVNNNYNNIEDNNQNIKEPDIKEPDVKEPDVKEPDVKEPDVKEPDVKEPDVKEPDVKEPDVKEPDVKEPDVKEPDVEEPNIEDPNVEEPNVEEPDVNKTGKYKDKTIYLTFDDGPSQYTKDILDILDSYGVKATFFVVGKEDNYSKKMYKEIVDRGHVLAMHSYSHKYSYIYKSLKNFKEDFYKIFNLLKETTGIEPSIYRFPGGSLNGVSKMDMKEIIRFFNKEGIAYYDWNVLNGDAERTKYTKEELIDNVISGIEERKTSNVLMHDANDKATTVETLSTILDKLTKEDATILPLDNDSPKIQMIRADSVN